MIHDEMFIHNSTTIKQEVFDIHGELQFTAWPHEVTTGPVMESDSPHGGKN